MGILGGGGGFNLGDGGSFAIASNIPKRNVNTVIKKNLQILMFFTKINECIPN